METTAFSFRTGLLLIKSQLALSFLRRGGPGLEISNDRDD